MNSASTLIGALLICFGLQSSHCCAADAAPPAVGDQMARQKEIYSSRDEKRPSGYVIDRTLSSYSETLLPDFET